MHEARFRADEFGEMGQEGDDVMLAYALDLVDPRDVEVGVRRPLSQIASAAAFGITPISARASQACASISNQIRKRVCGSQSEPFRGGNSAGSWNLSQIQANSPRASCAALRMAAILPA